MIAYPTPELRFVPRAVLPPNITQLDPNEPPKRIKILQQKWVKGDGNYEWRDVPLVEE